MTEEKSKGNIQKFSWKNFKKFDSYEEADKLRNNLLKEDKKVKIKRCGPGGSIFAVKIGTAVKRKGENHATE